MGTGSFACTLFSPVEWGRVVEKHVCATLKTRDVRAGTRGRVDDSIVLIQIDHVAVIEFTFGVDRWADA